MASERGSPHCDSATAVGGGGLRLSEGDGGGEGQEHLLHDLQPRELRVRRSLMWKKGVTS